MTTPAHAVSPIPRRGFLKLFGLIATGFAQPKPTNTKQIKKQKFNAKRFSATNWYNRQSCIKRGLGCPDVSILESLSKILEVSILELLNGEDISEEQVSVSSTNQYIKNTVDYSKDQVNHWKLLFSKVLLGLILFIGILLIFLNIINIYNINKEITYDYSSSSGDIEYFKDMAFNIKNNILIIKSKQGIYSSDDYAQMLDIVNKIDNHISSLNIFKYAEEKRKLKLNDLYVFNHDTYGEIAGMELLFNLYKYDKI